LGRTGSPNDLVVQFLAGRLFGQQPLHQPVGVHRQAFEHVLPRFGGVGLQLCGNVLGAHKFAVCARCTGLYVGFALATLFYPLVRSLRRTEAPPRKWLFVAAAPLAIDFSLTFFGIWENTHSSRFITGALLGAVAVFYVMPGLVDLSLRDWGKKSKARIEPEPAASPAMFSSRVSSAPSDYSAPHRRI